MSPPSRKVFQAVRALSVLSAYVLPLTVGIASQVSHELDHFMDELRGQGPETVLELEMDGPAGGAFVHAHGDVVAHAHQGGIGRLLVAAEHNDRQQGEAAAVALELVGHVPATGAPAVVFTTHATPASHAPRTSAKDVALRPPLPPPRLSFFRA